MHAGEIMCLRSNISYAKSIQMQMSLNKGFCSYALDSAHENFEIGLIYLFVAVITGRKAISTR